MPTDDDLAEPKCFACGGTKNLRVFGVTVDGHQLTLAPLLCAFHGDRYLLRVGMLLATLREDRPR